MTIYFYIKIFIYARLNFKIIFNKIRNLQLKFIFNIFNKIIIDTLIYKILNLHKPLNYYIDLLFYYNIRNYIYL